MRESWSIAQGLSEQFSGIVHFDQTEIDNPNKRHYSRLRYVDRLKEVTFLVRKYFSEMHGLKVVDLGCAQGNFTLVLAEHGCDVVAVEADPLFVEYAKRKYERGNVDWLNCDIDQLELPAGSFDVALLGEIITASPKPEKLVFKALELVRSGGIVIVTCPNPTRLFPGLPTFAEAKKAGKLHDVQIKNAGNHLFRLSRRDLDALVSTAAHLCEAPYCGSTLLINKYSQGVLNLLPLSWIHWLIRFLSSVPVISSRTFHTQCFVFRKNF